MKVRTRPQKDPESAGMWETELQGGNQPGSEPETGDWDCPGEETKAVTLPR